MPNMIKQRKVARVHNNFVELNLAESLKSSKAFKILFKILSIVNPETDEFYEFCLNAKDLQQEFDFNRANLASDLRAVCQCLHKIDFIAVREHGEHFYHLFEDIGYDTEKKIIEGKLSQSMKPYLLKIKQNYVEIFINHLSKFKSLHTIMIYLILKRYYFLRRHQITVEELKIYLNEPTLSYAHLKRIITRSVESINKKTALAIGFVEVKEGQKVVAIKFLFGREKQTIRVLYTNKENKDLRSMPYIDYLKTDHWKELREEVLERADNKCQLCSSSFSLQVHHNTYKRRGEERLTDLIVLCKNCHQKYHNKFKEIEEFN